MNSERKLFWEWAKSENPLLVEEAETGSQFHKDVLDYMFMGWQASASRQGFVLVPVEPTEEMYLTGYDCKVQNGSTIDIYKAMIGAADENY